MPKYALPEPKVSTVTTYRYDFTDGPVVDLRYTTKGKQGRVRSVRVEVYDKPGPFGKGFKVYVGAHPLLKNGLPDQRSHNGHVIQDVQDAFEAQFRAVNPGVLP